MSRLWPKQLHAGLFADRCWIAQSDGVVLAERAFPTVGWNGALREFAQLIRGISPEIGKRSRLSMITSDTMGSLIALPWQDALQRTSDYESYARVCFEAEGKSADEMVLYAGYRHYRAMGVAYAFRRAQLEALSEAADALELRLAQVLPVTAAAYWYCRLPRTQSNNVLVIQEKNRLAALVYNRKGLQGYLTEPASRNSENSVLRLLKRTNLQFLVGTVASWATVPDDSSATEKAVEALSDVSFLKLARNIWSKS